MPTSRTIRADAPGPVLVDAHTRSLTVHVSTVPNLAVAELTISTDDDSGPSADLVNNAHLDVLPPAADEKGIGGVRGGYQPVVSRPQTSTRWSEHIPPNPGQTRPRPAPPASYHRPASPRSSRSSGGWLDSVLDGIGDVFD
jgi:hypothetical protein